MVPDFLGKAIKIDLHKSSGIFPESYRFTDNIEKINKTVIIVFSDIAVVIYDSVTISW